MAVAESLRVRPVGALVGEVQRALHERAQGLVRRSTAQGMVAEFPEGARLQAHIPGAAHRVRLEHEQHQRRHPLDSGSAYLWPGKRLPDLYYDPRSLHDDPGQRAILHAKCVIIDDAQVFLTSANFTQAGQQRNLEAGLLMHDPALARDLTAQFDALARASALLRIEA
jgi:phosphatidylserine/phosphatidylglycerophosphate/cardiolipin synthase-like enzyme